MTTGGENEEIIDGDIVLEPADDRGACMKAVGRAQESLSRFFAKYGYVIRHVIYGILIAGYAAYFAYALRYEFGSESSVRLLWMTMVAVFFCFVTLIRDNFGYQIYDNVFEPLVNFVNRFYTIFKL